MVSLTSHGTLVTASQAELDALCDTFAREHCVRLRHLLSADLLQRVMTAVQSADFVDRIHQGTGIEPPPRDRMMVANSTLGLLHFLANDPALVRFVETVTGEAPLGRLMGNLYTISPTAGHFDTWHDDCSEGRRIAFSLNLSTEPYRGGLLQIRDRDTEALLHEVANTGVGDAILFRIAPGLQHRVSALEGTTPRTAFAGWYHSA